MLAVGQVGRLGSLGLLAGRQKTLVAQALAILARYGSAANLYLPGVGAINGLQAGNWLDSAGTTPATVDGQVGLVVSAGKAVGVNVFSDAAVAFQGESTRVSTGVYRIYSSAGAFSNVSVGGSILLPNRTYRLRFNVDSIISGALAIDGPIGSVLPVVSAGVGQKEVVVTMTTTTSISIKRSASVTDIQISDLRIEELPGSHLTQSTAANRPVLRLSGGVYAWDFVSSDSFTSTMTPGNAGFFCAAANVTDSGVLRTLLGAGADGFASSGVWLARAASNALTLQVGNGTTRNSVSAAYPVATNAVASAGWDASNMFVGINNTETSGAKSVNCTSANTMNVGVLTGTTNPMLGTISGGAIIMPTVLPTASERATLRQLIASLSGATL